jgi:hypothetical protein
LLGSHLANDIRLFVHATTIAMTADRFLSCGISLSSPVR